MSASGPGPDPVPEGAAAPSPAGAGSYRRDALLAGVSRMAPLGVQLAATPLVLASLGEGSFAAWALMMTTINLLLTADLGVVGIMQRYHGVALGRGDSALGGRITASVLLMLGALLVLVTLAGPLIADGVLAVVDFPPDVRDQARLLFRHAGTLAVLQLLALALSSYLAAHSRFLAVAGLSIGARAVLALGIAVALLGDHGLPGLLLASYADAVVAVLLGLWLCRHHLRHDVRRPTDRAETSDLWAYAWRNQASALGFVAQRELDVVLAGILLPTAALASMSAAAPLTAAVCLAPSVLLTPLFTRLSVQAGADPAGLPRAAADAERAWFALALPFGAVVLAVLPFAAAAWLGPELVDVTEVTALLAAGFLLTLVTSVRAILVRAAGRPGLESRSYAVYAVVKIAAGWALAMTFGLLGLAAAGVLAAVAAMVVLRRGAGALMSGGPSAAPARSTWLVSGAVLVVAGAASWWVSTAVDGRWAVLGLLVVIGAAAGATALAASRRRSPGTAPR
ncbi:MULTISPECIES: lipopolysaccharide biosynthesis protein [unclassified Actinotalea]|uniref:lipopolysaccharide biosynthesis protein n=1 Tax=unclassified Actinotalea TaxID=2638618 RepID=UPI0015F74B29|nr:MULTISPECIES: hypothetical protein [unclassified Actinotalea]